MVLEALLDGPVWPYDDRNRGAVGTRLVHCGLTQLRTPFFVDDAVCVELLQEFDACVASADRLDHRTGASQDAASLRGVREHAFAAMRERRVISLVRPENIPSQGVARQLDMVPEREVEFKGFRHLLFVSYAS